jgi:hypothetical protein
MQINEKAAGFIRKEENISKQPKGAPPSAAYLLIVHFKS